MNEMKPWEYIRIIRFQGKRHVYKKIPLLH